MNLSKNQKSLLRIGIYFFFICFTNLISAQKLLTYSDSETTYTFYKDSLNNEIKHGAFSTKYGKFGDKTDIITEKGNYINGQKDGLWLSREDFRIVTGDITRIGYEKNTATYLNGKLNGPWFYKVSTTGVFSEVDYISKKRKVIERMKENLLLKMNFKNGQICGYFELNDSSYNTYESLHSPLKFYGKGILSTFEGKITGQFNESGYMDGKWVMENGKFTAYFQNGTLINQFDFTLTNKGKYVDKEQDEELVTYRKKYANQEISNDDLKHKGFEIETVLLFERCSYTYLGGRFDFYLDCNTENYGKYVLITRTK